MPLQIRDSQVSSLALAARQPAASGPAPREHPAGEGVAPRCMVLTFVEMVERRVSVSPNKTMDVSCQAVEAMCGAGQGRAVAVTVTPPLPPVLSLIIEASQEGAFQVI